MRLIGQLAVGYCYSSPSDFQSSFNRDAMNNFWNHLMYILPILSVYLISSEIVLIDKFIAKKDNYL